MRACQSQWNNPDSRGVSIKKITKTEKNTNRRKTRENHNKVKNTDYFKPSSSGQLLLSTRDMLYWTC